MCFALCEVARVEFACDRVFEKSPYELGRYVAGMGLSYSSQGAVTAACVKLKELDVKGVFQILYGARMANDPEPHCCVLARMDAFEATCGALGPWFEVQNDAWEVAHYLGSVIFQSNNPPLVAAFFDHFLNGDAAFHDDFCTALIFVEALLVG